MLRESNVLFHDVTSDGREVMAYIEEGDEEDQYIDENGFFHKNDPDQLLAIDSNDNPQSMGDVDSGPPRALKCGGCVRLNGQVDGNYQKFTTTKYLDPIEYWGSVFAVNITGSTGSNGCKAPGGKVRLYDATKPGPSTNLGSPNEGCDADVGPGIGAGGAPKLSNGDDNPFKNCPSSAIKTAFTVQGSGSSFRGCNEEFVVSFAFKYPVTLNKLGLLNVVDGNSVNVNVLLDDGTKMEFKPKSGGPNSSQRMAFKGLKRTKLLTVRFRRAGAVEFVDYCHNCGDEDAVRKRLIDGYYPKASSSKAVETKDSVAYFEEILPDLNAVISTKLGQAVNDKYRHQTGHCMYQENVGVSAIMEVSTQTEAKKICSTPLVAGCNPRIISYEDFEAGDVTGWTNGKTTSASGFTRFLGRYGSADKNKNPYKTYTVPKDASEIKFEFDFLKIDTWDGHDNDSLHVVFNGKVVNLGVFRNGYDEGGRTGSSHGINHVLEAKTVANKNIGFRANSDQILHVTMYVPSSFFQSDGKLKVEFRTTLTQKLSDESAGFDNIKVTAKYDCADYCVHTSTVSFEDFEDGMTPGWINGRTEKQGAFTEFLGRYGNGMPSPRKTYTVPQDADTVELSFDFYEIDSWDKSQYDKFLVRIDDKTVNIGKFDLTTNEDGRSWKVHGVSYSLKSAGAPSNIGFGRWVDQIHHVTMLIPKSFFEVDGKLEIEFQTTLSESIDNESAGFDNIKVTAKYDCIRRRLALPVTEGDEFLDMTT